MFLQRMTDSMNRLVDFLTVLQKGELQSGILDANKVCSCQSLLQVLYVLCALLRVRAAVSSHNMQSFLPRLHALDLATCFQGQLRREIAKTSCAPKTTAPGGQVRLHQQVLDACSVGVMYELSLYCREWELHSIKL